MKKLRQQLQGSVGLVPTMGYLHDGHISLIQLAQQENDYVVVSIFVNPKQFGANEDYQTYPRDTKQDFQLLKTTGTDVVFLPDAKELYPSGYATYVEVAEITDQLEGKSRPNHFKGVTTIVMKLFNIVQPTHAYFGQKDAQQVAVVKKMVSELHISVDIVVGKTLRESDGLAMSSRNVFLTKEERGQAVVLSQSLSLAQKLFEKGERNPKKIKIAMENLIHMTTGNVDYISIANPQTLEELQSIEKDALVNLAIRFGTTRLIDNCNL